MARLLLKFCLWFLVLAGMTFFWTAVFDAKDAGLLESLSRTGSALSESLFHRPNAQ
jgi:hypothetical protein